jgi:hypothetical protein
VESLLAEGGGGGGGGGIAKHTIVNVSNLRVERAHCVQSIFVRIIPRNSDAVGEEL